jgi:hypothetical protein
MDRPPKLFQVTAAAPVLKPISAAGSVFAVEVPIRLYVALQHYAGSLVMV